MIKRPKLPVCIAISSALVALMYIFPIIFYLLSLVVYSVSLIFIVVKFVDSKNNNDKRVGSFCEKNNRREENEVLNQQQQHQSPNISKSLKYRSFDEIDKAVEEFSTIFGESCLDEDLLHTIDGCLHEVFKPWHDILISNDLEITNQLRQDFWQATAKLTSRLRNVNMQKMVMEKFCNIVESHIENTSYRLGPMVDEKKVFEDEDKEMEFLKKISEIIIILLLPREYYVSPIRIILCEIFAYKCLYSNISTISDPDFFNQNVIDFIKHRIVSEKPVENDGSILELSKRVDNSTTIDDLLHIRSSLLNDLFQALSINQNSKCRIFSKTRKNSVKLKEYIRSLSSIKCNCEEKLEILGLPDLSKYNLTLKDILATVIGRKYFISFLKSNEPRNLVVLHNQITKLKETITSDGHREYIEVLHNYLKSMKSFNFENDICTHDTLTDIQKKILDILEEKYYHTFVINSKEYEKLSNLLELTMTESQKSPITYEDLSDIDLVKLYVNTKNNIGELKENLNLKQEIYESLTYQPWIDLSSLKISIEKLLADEELFEVKLTKIESWLIGSESIKIMNVECIDNENFENFKISYSIIDNEEESMEVVEDNHKYEESSVSKVVTIFKNLDNVRQFNEEMEIRMDKLKSTKLFTDEFLDIIFNQYGVSSQINNGNISGQFKEYLNFVLDDSVMQESERVFNFFNSSVGEFRKKSVEDLVTPSSDIGSSDDLDSKSMQNCGDPIIEKIINSFSNMGKFFEGPNLKEKYLFSLLSSLLGGTWKDTSESKSATMRGDETKEMTSKLAKDLIIENIPSVLKIYEYQRPKKSLVKIFNVFQNQSQNRKLIYDLLDAVLMEMFPEMQKIQQTMSKTT